MLRVQTQMFGVAGAPYYSNHFFVGIDGQAAAEAAVGKVEAFWQLLDGLFVNELVIHVQEEVQEINVATGDLTGTYITAGGDAVGGSAAGPIPWVCQGLISWNTDTFVAGRRLRGRTYIPALSLDNLNALGGVAAGTITGFNAAATALMDPAGDADLAVWSRTHGQASTVTGFASRTYFAELRSRRD